MTIQYGKFELPTKIKVEEADESNTYARFIAEPLEKGLAHTLGNSLRRMMLTSLEAPSIISVLIEGVPHEYMAVDGIVEDVTHIILNIKNALLRKLPTDSEPGSRKVKKISKLVEIDQLKLDDHGGQYALTLGDVMDDSIYEIVNPDLVICHVTKPMTRTFSFKVAIGRGYVPSERHVIDDKIVDEIAIDSAFSPVRIVNYFVEKTRVGRDTDYDRLVLEVKTDGRVTPKEALAFATQIGVLHFNIFEELQFEEISFDSLEEEEEGDSDEMMNKLRLRINEIELSVRSTNCLSQANIDTIAELVIMPESEMLKFRNFGKKSLNEIKDKLEEMGLYLGMDLSRYGFTRENVKELIQQQIQEKVSKEA